MSDEFKAQQVEAGLLQADTNKQVGQSVIVLQNANVHILSQLKKLTATLQTVEGKMANMLSTPGNRVFTVAVGPPADNGEVVPTTTDGQAASD